MALLLDDERATEAALSFLRKTKAGQMATVSPREVESGEEEVEKGDEQEREVGEVGGEGRPAPLWAVHGGVTPLLGRNVGFDFFVSVSLFLFREKGRRRMGCLALTAGTRSVSGKCRMGTGLGEYIKAVKTSSCHNPFGLNAAGQCI